MIKNKYAYYTKPHAFGNPTPSYLLLHIVILVIWLCGLVRWPNVISLDTPIAVLCISLSNYSSSFISFSISSLYESYPYSFATNEK